MTKLKMIIIFAVAGLILIGLVLWRADGYLYKQRLELTELQLKAQVSASALAIQSEVLSLSTRYINPDLLSGKSDKVDWYLLQPYYGFFFIPADSNSDRKPTIFLKDKAYSNAVNAYTIEKAIGVLPSTKKNETLVRAFSDNQKQKHLIYLIPAGDKWFGFIGAGESVQNLFDKQKNEDLQFRVINPEGLTVGHSIREYIGTRGADDPIISQIQKLGSIQGQGLFDLNSSMKAITAFEKIPATSAFVIATVPLEKALRGRFSFLFQLGFLMFGGFLILIGVLYWFLNKIEDGFAGLLDRAQSLLQGVPKMQGFNLIPEAQEVDDILTAYQSQQPTRGMPAKVSASPAPAAGQFSLQGASDSNLVGALTQEKLDAYMKVASAMGHEFRAPLTAMLGYAQVIITKASAMTDGQAFMMAAESLLRETKNCRSLLDKLFTFAGVRSPIKSKNKVDYPIVQALRNLDSQLLRKGVKVIRKFEDQQSLVMSAPDLVKAYESIISNSIEAMERMAKKELEISSSCDENGHQVVIKDTGEGIEKGHLEKVFDPFFTTRTYANHLGLGLSVALGIFKEHGARIEIESERSKGATVRIFFELSVADVSESTELIESPLFSIQENTGKILIEEVDLTHKKQTVEIPVLKNRENEMIEEFKINKIHSSGNLSLDVNIDHLLEELPAKVVQNFAKDIEMEAINEAEFKGNFPVLNSIFTEEKPPVEFVSKPKQTLKKRTSKLDEVKVEIRRPGRRP